jgi:hypothetical protein
MILVIQYQLQHLNKAYADEFIKNNKSIIPDNIIDLVEADLDITISHLIRNNYKVSKVAVQFAIKNCLFNILYKYFTHERKLFNETINEFIFDRFNPSDIEVFEKINKHYYQILLNNSIQVIT